MRQKLTTTLLIVISVTATASADPPQDPLIEDQAFVRLAADVTLDEFLATINSTYPGTTVIDEIASRRLYLLDLPGGTNQDVLEAYLESLVFNGTLRTADLNYAGRAAEGHTGSIYVSFGAEPGEFQNQYADDLTGWSDAQTRSVGAGVAVAVLDTGIDADHPELAGRVRSDGWNFLTNDANVADVGNGSDDDGDGQTDEMVGHGTFTAGLIAQVAPDAKVLPIVVLDSDGETDLWVMLEGLYYAIDHGVEIVNMSLGSTYDADAFELALSEAQDLGIVVVGAGGNQNTNADDFQQHPAEEDDFALGVVATDHGDIKAWFSNYYRKMFISAPGASEPDAGDPSGYDLTRSIISSIPGGDYAVWEGTSMATPFVSGAAALIRGQHPEWPADASTFFNIRSALATSAVDIYDLNPQYREDQELGAGRLDIAAAVALGPVAPAPGDLDGNGSIDLTDLSILLGDYGSVHSSADIDADGVVGLSDLSILLGGFGG